MNDWLNIITHENAYDLAVENGFVGSLGEWLDHLQGKDGLSAYALARNNGFVGTLTDWLASLEGDKAWVPVYAIEEISDSAYF